MGGIFAIGAGGMRRLGASKVRPLVGHAYHLGASSSPKRIIVTRVGADRFWYRSHPYQGPDVAIETTIGCDLIETACRSLIKAWTCNGPDFAERMAGLQRVLDGGPGEPDDVDRWIPFTATVQLRPGRDVVKDFADTRYHDPWYALEAYGAVGRIVDPATGSQSWCVDGYAFEIVNLASDLRFEAVEVKPREV